MGLREPPLLDIVDKMEALAPLDIQIVDLCQNNRILVVLTKLNFWPFCFENGLEGQF